MTQCILGRLRLRSADRVLDVGCGTGLYARQLVEHTEGVVCVDPSVRMLEQIPDDPRLVAVQSSAEDLASGCAVLPVDRFEAILRQHPGPKVAFRDRFAFVLGTVP